MRRLGEVLREIEQKLPPAVRQLIEVDRVWNDIMQAVGIPPELSKPLFIWGGHLHVAVKTPSVGQAIRLRARDVIARLRELGVDVSDLRFHTGRGYFKKPVDGGGVGREDGCLVPPDELIAEAEAELSDVDDPEIRKKLAILVARGRCKNG